ncbi:MAG TPA: hypothetical protein VM513_30145 [Kofleriaceae bacterium]|jgi:hypothetical protein|nr:hypothetical protein [Kofleriaceae bacterium]
MRTPATAAVLLAARVCGDDTSTTTTDTSPRAPNDSHDTFGDEQLWSDTRRLDELVWQRS